mgnify:CR=1 FL=1
MLMRHPMQGWHNAMSSEVEEMKKNGWLESSYEERAKIVAAKYAPQSETTETPETLQEKPNGKPGRKPKNPR